MDVKALSFSLQPYIERNGNSDLGVCVCECVHEMARAGGRFRETKKLL